LEASHLKLPYHTPKLAPRCQGPFRVNKVISPVAYQLVLPLSWGIHNVFHASLLLPYRETTTHGPNFEHPPPSLIEDAEEYEVEAVINHRHYGRRHQLQYLIKWKGYPSSDNTWEPKDNVHAEDLVKEYHRRHPLNSVKRATGRGTRKLIRALLTPTPPLSPTNKVKAWLLASSLRTPSPDTHAVLPPTSRCSLSPPTSRWLLKPFKSSRSGSQERAPETLGNSYNNSRISCGLMSGVDRTKEQGLVTKTLRNALLGTTRRSSSLKTLPCRTLPNGRGRPL